MKLSTKGRYGARAVIELALRYGSGPVLVREIADKQDISEKYLENILNSLRNAGILKSTRGAKGGYELAKEPSSITLGDIVRSLEGDVDIVSCGKEKCPRISQCIMNEIWCEISNSINEIMDKTNFADLVKRYNKLNKKTNIEYVI
jgi:Rrf2 family transcriptional regulator, cysteine metabolism repressor